MIKSIFRLFNFKTIFILVLYLIFKNENKTIRAYEIKEESMKPALLPDEYVLSVKLKEAPKRGDIVVFTNTEKNIDVVKRVIGLPNENVSSSDGEIIINSEKIDDEWSKNLTTYKKALFIEDILIIAADLFSNALIIFNGLSSFKTMSIAFCSTGTYSELDEEINIF